MQRYTPEQQKGKLYFKWLKAKREMLRMGNNPKYRKDPDATHFFNPIKGKGKKTSNNKVHRSS